MSASDSNGISLPSGAGTDGMWEFLRVLFKTAPHGIVIHEAGGAIISANAAAERMLGLSLAELQGRTSMDPRWKAIREDASPFPAEFHPAMRALRTGKATESVVFGVFNPREETTVWLKVSAVPVFRPGEASPFQAFAMFTDVTELKLAERALRESEQQFRSIFDHSPEALLIRPVDGPYLEVNHCALDRYGYTRDEMIGMPPEDLVPARLRDRLRMRIRAALETWEPVEWVHRRKDGAEVPVVLHVRPLFLQGRHCIYEMAQSPAGPEVVRAGPGAVPSPGGSRP